MIGKGDGGGAGRSESTFSQIWFPAMWQPAMWQPPQIVP